MDFFPPLEFSLFGMERKWRKRKEKIIIIKVKKLILSHPTQFSAHSTAHRQRERHWKVESNCESFQLEKKVCFFVLSFESLFSSSSTMETSRESLHAPVIMVFHPCHVNVLLLSTSLPLFPQYQCVITPVYFLSLPCSWNEAQGFFPSFRVQFAIPPRIIFYKFYLIPHQAVQFADLTSIK